MFSDQLSMGVFIDVGSLLIIVSFRQKNQMKNDAGKDVQMLRLFHGTECEYIDAVCHGNTDWSFSTIKDTRFGRGE